MTPIRGLTLLLGAIAVVALAACGGGGGKSSSSSSSGAASSPEEAAKQFVLGTFGMFTGQTSGQDVINMYAPECRQGVKSTDIDAAMAFFKIFAPALGKAKFQDVDLGQLDVQKSGDSATVTPKDPNALRVKVDGKWIDANQYFKSLGFDSSDSPADSQPLSLVLRNGKWYQGDCKELQSFTGGGGLFGGDTPTATPTRGR